jgi:hypothetical protein
MSSLNRRFFSRCQLHDHDRAEGGWMVRFVRCYEDDDAIIRFGDVMLDAIRFDVRFVYEYITVWGCLTAV